MSGFSEVLRNWRTRRFFSNPITRILSLSRLFCPPDRVVWDSAEALIKRWDKIYCFWDSSVRKDCEMLGKRCEIIGAEEISPESS